MEDGIVILIEGLVLGSVIFAIIIGFGKKYHEEDKTIAPSKKVFKLFNNDGVLIREYKDVFVTHWDGNIYFLYHEYEGKRFITIDKGDMLLSIEKMSDAVKALND